MVAMTAAIEARSLSAVLALADDPPLNPNDGPKPLQDGLVLYIARVPGSRGIVSLQKTLLNKSNFL